MQQQRINEIEALNFCFNHPLWNNLPDAERKSVIKDIETGMLNHSIDLARIKNIPVYWNILEFVEIYNSVGYRIKINIDPDSDVNVGRPDDVRYYLINLLYNYALLNALNKFHKWHDLPADILLNIGQHIKKVNPSNLGKMDFHELNPYINQHIIEEIKIKTEQVINVKYSTMYTCNKCGEKKTNMRELQTRSGDEGGTLFIYCLICNNVWRQYG